MRIALATRKMTRPGDAISAHSRVIATAFRQLGHEADVIERLEDGSWHRENAGASGFADAIRPYDLAILAYNPFLYGRRGVAPRLVREFYEAHKDRVAPQIALLVHEPYVEAIGVREALHAAYLRTQLAAMRVSADVVLASIEAWTTALGRWRPRRPTEHVPSGSVLPDRRMARADARNRVGASESTLVVATLSSGHPSHMTDFVASAIRAAAHVSDVLLLALGAGAVVPRRMSGVQVVAPGALSDSDLAEHLSAADIFLSPLDDGVSTRRTSVMAALQHGTAVVGTLGKLTDSELMSSAGLVLTPVDSIDAFISATVDLAADGDRRSLVGSAARRMYEERYSPELIAKRILAACAR